MLLLKGKPVADHIYSQLSENLGSGSVTRPHLAVIIVGEDPASQVYVSHKQKACENLGYQSSLFRLHETTTEAELSQLILKLNGDASVHGILLQLPLPAHLEAKKMTNLISPLKDADSLTVFSLGQLAAAQNKVASCTPAGIMEILKFYKIDVARKNVLVIGRSLIVGIPLFHLLNQQNATVTLAHSQTENLKELVKNFDYVFVAVGKPHFLKATDFKKSAVVIDVGIHRTDKGLVGDVNPEGGEGYLRALTPVPGGVGPMTIAMLMYNTYQLANA
ncbi:MAG: bifunctional 5,10-methylenetetrahydrofolate dehydrogenase/5,10-methenyltetrahydrofolate cyclohydrolase [Pseudobdellovibrio sp.]